MPSGSSVTKELKDQEALPTLRNTVYFTSLNCGEVVIFHYGVLFVHLSLRKTYISVLFQLRIR